MTIAWGTFLCKHSRIDKTSYVRYKIDMAILTFDTLADLYNHFNSVVYQDIQDDSLLVQDVTNNVWHRYAWTHGRREIRYRETVDGDLTIIIQIYPET